MPISQATIEELQIVLKEDYGRDVSYAETSEIINSLTSYYDLLAKIYHRDKLENNYDNEKITNK